MGDVHRIIKAKDKKFSDAAFEKLLRDSDKGRLSSKLSPFFTRPVYAYTKAAVGGHKSWLTKHMTNS